MKFYVYQLRASDESDPFYVGKTFEGSKRLVEHFWASKNDNRMVSSKIRSVLLRGASVIQEPLRVTDDEPTAHAEERRLIALHGRRDNNTGILCNHTDGGEGAVGQVHTPETKVKMSLAKRGNKINVGRARPDLVALSQKPISMFDATGALVRRFNSSREAAVATGINKATVSDCLKGKCRTARTPPGKVYQFCFGHETDSMSAVQYRQRSGLGEVLQYTKAGELVAKYRNSKEAHAQTNIAGESIRACVHGTAKSAGGFVWKLAEKSVG